MPKPKDEPVVFKALVISESRPGKVDLMDVIRRDGALWLVPLWTENQSEGWQEPERMILLDQLSHEAIQHPRAQYLVHDPLPTAVLYGPDPSSAGPQYVVRLRPGVRLPLPGKLN